MLYANPVWQLLHDMVQDLGLTPDQTFTRQQALAWFARRYPRVNPGTVIRHLYRLSTNAPGRVHYSPVPGRDDLLYQIDQSRYRLYDPRHDPPPLRDGASPPADGCPRRA